MKDRIPANPGRVLITPESGGAPYYATITRADNPTQKGTPLNKNTLLKDATAAMFGMGADAVPDDVFNKIKTVLDGYSASIAAGVKIATGTYTGTGKYGEANPSSLTLPFEANTLIIVGTDGFLAVCPHLTTSYVSFEAHTVNGREYNLGGLFVKKNGNTVQRYSTSGSPAATWTPRFQANAKGTTYRYIAWG